MNTLVYRTVYSVLHTLKEVGTTREDRQHSVESDYLQAATKVQRVCASRPYVELLYILLTCLILSTRRNFLQFSCCPIL